MCAMLDLNNVRLLVDDFDESFRFYAETLGLKVTWGKPGACYASFDIGLPSGLALFRADLMAEALGDAATALPEARRGKAVLVLKVEDVDETYGLLSRRGVVFLDEPRDMSAWGIRAAHFRDPEGNLLEIYTDLPPGKCDAALLQEMEKSDAAEEREREHGLH